MKSVFVGVILSVLATTIGCTKNKNLDYGLKVEETIRINLQQEPPSLDWNKSTDTTSALINFNIMEGLVDYDLSDPDHGLKAALAESWSPDSTSKVWTFKIRPGVKWTDGQPFTPQQVVDGWERLLNPATASQYAYFLFTVQNAQKYNKGEIKDFSQVGVKVDDKGQLVVTLERPQSYFPYLLTHHSTYPIRKDVVEKYGDRWTEPGNIQTIGAYSLKIWDHDKAIVLERNEGYYGDKAKVKNIYGYMINEFSTAFSLFEAGKLDYQNTVPGNEISNLKGKPFFKQTPLLGIYYYGFNLRKPPFDNVKVRKAFVHAIDRGQVASLLDVEPLSGWVPKGMFGYDAKVGLKLDVAKAKKLLEEAGYKDGKNFPKVTLGFNTNENHQRVAENVQAQLKKNLGIQIELQNEEWKVYLNRLQSDTPNLFRLGWLADYPDPDNFLNLMTSYSENNHTGWKNAKFDEWIANGSSVLDKEERRRIYAKAQQLLTEEDAAVMPVYSMKAHLLVSERMKDFPVNSLERVVFKGVSLQ